MVPTDLSVRSGPVPSGRSVVPLSHFGPLFFCLVMTKVPAPIFTPIIHSSYLLSPHQVFVGGLAWATEGDHLREHFGQFGEVTDAVVLKDRETGRSRGFGFVTFAGERTITSFLFNEHFRLFHFPSLSLPSFCSFSFSNSFLH